MTDAEREEFVTALLSGVGRTFAELEAYVIGEPATRYCPLEETGLRMALGRERACNETKHIPMSCWYVENAQLFAQWVTQYPKHDRVLVQELLARSTETVINRATQPT